MIRKVLPSVASKFDFKWREERIALILRDWPLVFLNDCYTTVTPHTYWALAKIAG